MIGRTTAVESGERALAGCTPGAAFGPCVSSGTPIYCIHQFPTDDFAMIGSRHIHLPDVTLSIG
jgi:hypothetical protein